MNCLLSVLSKIRLPSILRHTGVLLAYFTRFSQMAHEAEKKSGVTMRATEGAHPTRTALEVDPVGQGLFPLRPHARTNPLVGFYLCLRIGFFLSNGMVREPIRQ